MKILRFIQISVVSCLTAACASCAKDGYKIPAGSDTDFSGQAEPSKVEVKHFSKKDEHYFLFALAGALLLIAEALGRYTLLRKIP